VLRAGERAEPRAGTRAPQRPEVDVLVRARAAADIFALFDQRWWVDDQQIEGFVALAQEATDVGGDERGAVRRQAVQRPVPLGGGDCGAGAVHGDDAGRAAGAGVHGEAAVVREASSTQAPAANARTRARFSRWSQK
jgi:hypothetical protein